MSDDPRLARYYPMTLNEFNVAVPFNGYLQVIHSGYTCKITPGKLTVKSASPTGWGFCAQKDNAGNVWIGCTNGLSKFNNGKIILSNQGLPEGLHVLSIAVSDPDDLWIATDKGLIHRSHGVAKKYTKHDGLPRLTMMGYSA
jgi:hypothetical protein